MYSLWQWHQNAWGDVGIGWKTSKFKEGPKERSTGQGKRDGNSRPFRNLPAALHIIRVGEHEHEDLVGHEDQDGKAP